MRPKEYFTMSQNRSVVRYPGSRPSNLDFAKRFLHSIFPFIPSKSVRRPGWMEKSAHFSFSFYSIHFFRLRRAIFAFSFYSSVDVFFSSSSFILSLFEVRRSGSGVPDDTSSYNDYAAQILRSLSRECIHKPT